MFIFLHLSLFFVAAAAGLWADQLFHGPIAAISEHNALYATLLLFTLIVSFKQLTTTPEAKIDYLAFTESGPLDPFSA